MARVHGQRRPAEAGPGLQADAPSGGEALFPPVSEEARRDMEALPGIIDRLFPLARRFRSALPHDVAELSRLLTSGRSERDDGYLGRPPLLSAYLRYFLPWNVYRLARLIPGLSLALGDGEAITDLGSGPLTLPLALWIARPDLRKTALEFRCLDRAAAALEAGKAIFSTLTESASPWRIKTIRAPLGAPIRGPKAALVTALNVFNEVSARPLRGAVERYGELLVSLAAPSGSVLVVEPGIPSSGEFIAALRAALAIRGFLPRVPCPCHGACPMPGDGRGAKWCHFAFDTQGAPQSLLRLSTIAGTPKERAVLSFLLAAVMSSPQPAADRVREPGQDTQIMPNSINNTPTGILSIRIISDPFPLPGLSGKAAPRWGRYGCSTAGLTLLAGDGPALRGLEPGTLARLPIPVKERRDPKSGALTVDIMSHTRCFW